LKLPDGITRERALAFAGLAGLIGIGLACLVMIAGAFSGSDEEAVSTAAPIPTRTQKPTPTPKPKPTPVPLTAEQRTMREAAAQIVTSRGFEVVKLRDYDPRRTLRVLIGRETSGLRRAFFFVDERYIGNDAGESSAKIKVKRQGRTQVTLTYGLAQGGPVDVRFRWDGTKLIPLEALPSAALRAVGD
jgi:hypothetical protein